MQHLTLKPLLVQGKHLAAGTGDVGATLRPLLVQGKRLATDTGDLAATLNPYWFRENDGRGRGKVPAVKPCHNHNCIQIVTVTCT